MSATLRIEFLCLLKLIEIVLPIELMNDLLEGGARLHPVLVLLAVLEVSLRALTPFGYQSYRFLRHIVIVWHLVVTAAQVFLIFELKLAVDELFVDHLIGQSLLFQRLLAALVLETLRSAVLHYEMGLGPTALLLLIVVI